MVTGRNKWKTELKKYYVWMWNFITYNLLWIWKCQKSRAPLNVRSKSKITNNNFTIFLLFFNLPLFFLYQLSADLLPPGIQTFQLFFQHLSICCWRLLNNLFTSYIQCFENSLLSPNAILKLLKNIKCIHVFIKMSSMKQNPSSHTGQMERGESFCSPLNSKWKIQSQVDRKTHFMFL